MEYYRTFNTDYLNGRVFYSPESGGGGSRRDEKALPRERPVYWARDAAEYLEKAKVPPKHLRYQLVGQCLRVFTKKPDDPCFSR